MPLSDQLRPYISFDAVHYISPAVARHKYHVNCVASTPGSALRFRQDKIYNELKKTGEHDLSQHFICHRDKGDATTVAIFCSVTPLHVYKNSVGIFSLLWETLSGPAVKDKIMQSYV